MVASVATLWTDERINATINKQYILDQLEPDERALVTKPLSFGGGLTDDTYLDWVLTRARRLFLILVDIGIPDQIFGLVDESYDDNDLPVAAEAIPALRLSKTPNKALDQRFYKAQIRFTVKVLRPGEHIRFGREETIPLEPIGSKTGIPLLNNHDTDKVILPGAVQRVYTRRKIVLNQEPSCLHEEDVLGEVALLTKYAHEHIVSFYASYAEGSNVYVLLTPAPEWNLKTFLSDPPKHFENLEKRQRREILVNWPHCLANALAWLHSKGRHHGAIRPSNIHVDAEYKIFLGQFDAFQILHQDVKTDDVEAYQYAAPERWKRAATAQATGNAKTLGNSGGRSARRPAPARPQGSGTSARNSSWTTEDRSERAAVDTTKPTNTAVPFIPSSKSRIKLEDYRPGTSMTIRPYTGSDAASIKSSNSSGTKKSSSTVKSFSKTFTRPQSAKHRSEAPSFMSSGTGSSSGKASAPAAIPDPIAVPSADVRTAIVQTWQSAEHDPFPSDIFTFGAICLDILSFLCKRSLSAFGRHRSAKNRTAGRGGGLADASFHANVGQLYSWCKILDDDARKKLGKADGSAYGAVKPMLEVVLKCIEKDPHLRLTAGAAEKGLAECVSRHANVDKPHCTNMIAKPNKRKGPSDTERVKELPVLRRGSSQQSNGMDERKAHTVEEDMANARKQAVRNKLGLPAEPAIAHDKSGRRVDKASPFGYLSAPQPPGGPRSYSSQGQCNQWDDNYYNSEATSPDSRDIEDDASVVDLQPSVTLQSSNNGEHESEWPSAQKVDSAPSLPLNRFSAFKVDMRQYSDDTESLRTIETIRPQYQEEDEDSDDMEDYPVRNLQSSRDTTRLATKTSRSRLNAPDKAAHRSSRMYGFEDDGVSERDYAPSQSSDPTGRHASIISDILSTSSQSSDPNFSWGDQRSYAPSIASSRTSEGSTTGASPRWVRKDGPPSRSSRRSDAEERMSNMSTSSRSTQSTGRRAWPLPTTDEEFETPVPRLQHNPIPAGMPPPLPMHSKPRYRQNQRIESDHEDPDTETTSEGTGPGGILTPASMTSQSTSGSGSPVGYFRPPSAPKDNNRPNEYQRPPAQYSAQTTKHPQRRHPPPNISLPPVPAVPNAYRTSNLSPSVPSVRPPSRQTQQQPPSSRSSSQTSDPHAGRNRRPSPGEEMYPPPGIRGRPHNIPETLMPKHYQPHPHPQQHPADPRSHPHHHPSQHEEQREFEDEEEEEEEEEDEDAYNSDELNEMVNAFGLKNNHQQQQLPQGFHGQPQAQGQGNGRWMKGEGGRYYWDDGRDAI